VLVPSAVMAAQQKTEEEAGESSEEKHSNKGKSNAAITFASTSESEPDYTDGGIAHPKHCPVGGSWRGSFENIGGSAQKRKDKNANRVPETFYLFFNATPPSDARVTFADDTNEPLPQPSSDHDPNSSQEDDEEGEGDSNEKKRISQGYLPKSRLHVRGMGTNQFGTFEITGSYDLSSGILHCQRMYVVTTDGTSPGTSSADNASFNNANRRLGHTGIAGFTPGSTARVRKKRTSFGAVITTNEDGTTPKRSYFTRKRQMSWQRKPRSGSLGGGDASQSGEEEDHAGSSSNLLFGGGGKKGNKRPRVSSTDGSSSVKSSGVAGKNIGTAAVTSTVAGHSNDATTITGTFPSGGSSSILPAAVDGASLDPMQFNRMTSSSSIDVTDLVDGVDASIFPNLSSSSLGDNAGTFMSDTAAATPGGKKVKSSSSPSSVSLPFPTTEEQQQQQQQEEEPEAMTLPLAGAKRDARWKAAHYMYYQRVDLSSTGNTPDSSSNNNNANNNSANTSQTMYVIYEGEFNNGNNKRDGRGICLYNNGTLYEGHWKNNKEHGWGKLMFASDRDKVIYEGDWERGRMHGTGTYNYYHEQNESNEGAMQGGGRTYTGDFKENARHGVGKYVLPGGSIYDGEWRENVPSGRGTFHWVDGSMYVGQWKNGKRHGSGTLRCSDGFSYDGMWNQNAMEGRGTAIYPKGQRYEGMWSGGKREGRGTIRFTNGAIYEGRFRGDCMEGQGTMKMNCNVLITTAPKLIKEDGGGSDHQEDGDKKDRDGDAAEEEKKGDWMIPIEFQSDISHIHQKAGFTTGGV